MRYLRLRGNPKPTDPPLGHKYGGRFDRTGIEAVIISLSKLAGLEKIPSPHDFKRAFTKEALKNSDVVTVARFLRPLSPTVEI